MINTTTTSRIPQFNVIAHDGSEVDTEKLLGQVWVIYFYPRDNTPGCTIENKEFSSLQEAFAAHNIALFGVSRDSNRKHQNFCSKHALKIPLIADTDEQLCSIFDVMIEKNMYGKKVRGIERSTFIINKEGSIAQSWRKVIPEGHAAEVLTAAIQLSE